MERYRFADAETALLEQMPAPLAVYQFIDKRVVTLALSKGFCDLFGYDDREEAYHDMDNDMYKNTHPDDVARIAEEAFLFATKEKQYEVVYRTKKPGESDYFYIHAVGQHVYTPSGVRLAYVWYTNETVLSEASGATIQEILRTSQKASYYDFLTGLPSMTYFFELAQAGKETILREGGQPAVLYMDFGGMKFFNKKYGFAVGDDLLRSFAKLLTRTFSNENCSHFGADHFAVFTEREGLENTIRQLFEECALLNDGNSLPLRVGVYPNWTQSEHISIACDRAKFACDGLKRSYASTYNFYRQDLQDDAERRQYILAHLDKAIEKHWIQVYYQPIVRAVNGRVCDEEALARWIDPVRGFLSPADFIPVLEEAELIYKLDLYVLDQVLEKIKSQEQAGLYIVPQSVNLSRSDFDSCDVVEEIRARVDAAGVPRDKITIEITESVIGSDFDFMKEQIIRFRSLGFPVWMDDFGSGYSSMEVLQSIHFDLIKFDMSFMRRFNEGNNAKIVLTELVKMATELGADTVCEGVETKEQVQFLREIGCSKLQGYFYSKPNSLAQIFHRYETGTQIGFENPAESGYFELIGRVNLYDLAVIADKEQSEIQNFFNTLPIGIMEISGELVRVVRSNQAYRDFMLRFFKMDLASNQETYAAMPKGFGASFMAMVKECCATGSRAFYDEKIPDGTTIHSFARRIAQNPVTGTVAIAVAVLSITDEGEGATYASIARALAADYYNLYYVDLETDEFIEYSSRAGEEKLAMERRGIQFFDAVKRDTMTRIYEEDRDPFRNSFTKENIVQELDERGVFTITYRLVDFGNPMYVNMKVMRMQSDNKHIIIGISIVDSQMKQRETEEKLVRERIAFGRIAALSGGFLSLYTVDPETDCYLEFSASSEFETLGIAKQGEDFFGVSAANGRLTVHPDDVQDFLTQFTKENVMRCIKENGLFAIKHRLNINGTTIMVSVRAALVQESDGEKLIVGIRKA